MALPTSAVRRVAASGQSLTRDCIMHKAIALAEGDYIVFLNAGDTLADEGVLQRVVNAIYASFANPNGGADVVYGETDIVDAEGRFLRHRRLSVPERLTWRSFRHGMLVCHQSFYVRTAMARLLPYDTSWRFSADFDWCIRVLRTSRVVVRAEGVLTHYLDGGMTQAHHRASLIERLRIMARHYGWCTAIAMHAWFVIRMVVKR